MAPGGVASGLINPRGFYLPLKFSLAMGTGPSPTASGR